MFCFCWSSCKALLGALLPACTCLLVLLVHSQDTYPPDVHNMPALQIIITVILFVLMPIYYRFQLRPAFKRMNKESRRMAELLSQVPTSIDVEGDRLVFSVSAAYGVPL